MIADEYNKDQKETGVFEEFLLNLVSSSGIKYSNKNIFQACKKLRYNIDINDLEISEP